MNIFIIGSGSFGTALAKALSANSKNNIVIYSIDNTAIKNIRKYSENKAYLPGIKLPENVSITDEISLISDSDIIIFAVPSSVFVTVCNNIKNYYKDQIIVSASKGITDDGNVLTVLIEKSLRCNSKKVLSLSGPSIAIELASEKTTYLILGGDRRYTQIAKNAFESNFLLIRCTRDKKGIQYLGFYKNILAILVGLSDGLKLGNNMKSALITKAYSEFYYLNQNRRIRRHSFIDYAGLGDLYLTSTSEDSRNRNFGKKLAAGLSSQKILKNSKNVVEGYSNLLKLKKHHDNGKDCSWFEKNLLNSLLSIIQTKSPIVKKELLLKYLNSSEIKALVFDWGNVLTEDYYSMHVAKLLAKKYNLNQDKLLEILEINEKQALLGKENLRELYLRIKKYYPMLSFKFFSECYSKAITWNKPVLQLCERLSKNYNLYILSNNYNWVTPKLKPTLRPIFKGMIFSNEVKMIKPNNNIFNKLLERYNLRPENCIYVDDSLRNILAGERNKFNIVKFNSIKDLETTLAKKIIGFVK
ncbi:MAG: HAD-IA family hydrolase [Candidatus Woesearchaeota archaeon]